MERSEKQLGKWEAALVCRALHSQGEHLMTEKRQNKIAIAVLALTIGITASGGAADARHHKHHHHDRHADKQMVAGLFKRGQSDESTAKPKEEAPAKPKKEASTKSKEEKAAEPAVKLDGVGADSTPARKQPASESPTTGETGVRPYSSLPTETKSESTTEANPFQLDTALLSVMKDIDKALVDSEDVSKLADASQRAAVKAAIQALEVSLSKSANSPNRIVSSESKERLEKNVVAQSWDSGDINLPGGSRASMNVLWAKKVNGLVNISIAGNCGCRANSPGERTGEFVVVINGKSTLDSGFDIQSQSNVNFWLGKLNNISVDATACGETQVSTGQTVPTLKALMTESRRTYLAQHPELVGAEEVKVAVNNKPTEVKAVPVQILEPAAPVKKKQPAIAESGPKPASATARVVAPKRAVAGQYITVSVLNSSDRPESFVELNFNDYKANTNGDGQLVFQVPEDASPGPSLAIALPSRPDADPIKVEVLQPLMRPSETDLPKIDRVSNEKRILTVDGHNFDGIADHNHVLIDGVHEAQVILSSPVQLKAFLPDAVAADAAHTVAIRRNGLQSEPMNFGSPRDQLVSKTRKKS